MRLILNKKVTKKWNLWVYKQYQNSAEQWHLSPPSLKRVKAKKKKREKHTADGHYISLTS